MRMPYSVTQCLHCMLIICQRVLAWLGLFNCKSFVTHLYYSGACGVGMV